MISNVFARRPLRQAAALFSLALLLAGVAALTARPLYHAVSLVRSPNANDNIGGREQAGALFLKAKRLGQPEILAGTARCLGWNTSRADWIRKHRLRIAVRPSADGDCEVEVWCTSKQDTEQWVENALAVLAERLRTGAAHSADVPALESEWHDIEQKLGHKFASRFDVSAPQNLEQMLAELATARRPTAEADASGERLNALGKLRVELQDPALDAAKKLQLLTAVLKIPPTPVEAAATPEDQLGEALRQFESEYQRALEAKTQSETAVAPVEEITQPIAPTARLRFGNFASVESRMQKLTEQLRALQESESPGGSELIYGGLLESGLQKGALSRTRVFFTVLAIGAALALVVPLTLLLARPTFSDPERAGSRLRLRNLGAVEMGANHADGAALECVQAAAFPESVARTGRVLLVSSAVPREGKTSFAKQLALSTAHTGRRTLLIDADLRRGRVHQLWGFRRTPGLREVLEGTATIAATIRSTAQPELSILTAGQRQSANRELLGTPACAEMLATLRESFECIILDAAPVLGLPDTSFLLGNTDAVIVVIRKSFAPSRSVQAAVELLRKQSATLLGFVFNDVNGAAATHHGRAHVSPQSSGTAQLSA